MSARLLPRGLPGAAALAALVAGCFTISPPGPCTEDTQCGAGAHCSAEGACVEGPAPDATPSGGNDASGSGGAGGGSGGSGGGGSGGGGAQARVDLGSGGGAGDGGPPPPADATSRPDAPVSPRDGGGATDGSPPGPDAATPDMAVPRMDAFPPTPDFGPAPDAAAPEPDAGDPVLDAGPPAPDAAARLPELIDLGAPLYVRVGEPARLLAEFAPDFGGTPVDVIFTATLADGRTTGRFDVSADGVTFTATDVGVVTLWAQVRGRPEPPLRRETTAYDCVDADSDGDLALSLGVPDDLALFSVLCPDELEDCDDSDATRGPSATETCDGVDNDCDGVTDPPSVAVTPTDCGACGAPCVALGAEATCVAGRCDYLRCQDGYADRDGDRTNGCEMALGLCQTVAADDTTCDGIDDDCDGARDEDSQACDAWATGFCATRAGEGHLDVACLDFDTPPTAPWRSLTPLSAEPAPPRVEGGRLRFLARGASGTSRAIPTLSGEFRVRARVMLPVGGTAWLTLQAGDQFIGDRAAGLALRLTGGDTPRATLESAPPGGQRQEIAAWDVPALADGGAHEIEWHRDAADRHAVLVDAHALPVAVPQVGGAPALDGLDRLGVALTLTQGDPDAGGLDNLVLSTDADQDGLLTPEDNCPEVPAQVITDEDADGRGQPCDDLDADGLEDGADACRARVQDAVGGVCASGGTQVIVSMITEGVERLWRVDLAQGTRAPFSGATTNPLVAAVGRSFDTVTATAERAPGEVIIRSTQNGSDVPIEHHTASVGDLIRKANGALFYTSSDFGRVTFHNPANGATVDRPLGSAGERLRLAESPEANVLGMLTVRPDGSGLLDLIDDNFVLLIASIQLAGLDPRALPALGVHPNANAYLLAYDGRVASGLVEVVRNRPNRTTLTDAPVHRAIYDNASDDIIALMGDPPSLVRLDRPNLHATTLIGPDAGLTTRVLSYAPLEALPDRDADGLADEADACDGRPPFSRVAHDLGPMEDAYVQLLAVGDEYLLATHRGATTRVDRLGPALDLRAPSVSLPDTVTVSGGLGWDGARYGWVSLQPGFQGTDNVLTAELGADLRTMLPGDFAAFGLACEPDCRARLVARGLGDWLIVYGPHVARIDTLGPGRASVHSMIPTAGLPPADAGSAVAVAEGAVFFAVEVDATREVTLVRAGDDLVSAVAEGVVADGDNTARHPALAALDSGNVALVTVDAGTIAVRLPDVGFPNHTPPLIVSHPAFAASDPVVVAADAGYGIAWREVRDGRSQVWFCRVDAAGRAGRPVLLSELGAHAGPPALAWDGTRYVVAYRVGAAPGRLEVLSGRFDCP